MRKFFYCLFIVLLVTICVFGFSACNKKRNADVDLSGNISYAETQKYSGSNDSFRASVTAGIKEKLFIVDGKATDVQEFGTISVTPLKTSLMNKTYGYVLVYDGGEISGQLTRDVVTHSYTADVDIKDFADKITALKVVYDETESEIPLTNQMEGKITYQQALDIAKGEFKDIIAENATDGVLNREICVKLIRDKRNPESPYYWYVSFISADNNYWAILLNPDNGEVVTKKS